ncbi:Pex19 protein family [Schizosaccharomyces japonicus yFS275]|uniref:Pex19 protein family n=1 Tax=Schizosaccharomyces japonicus (strain yFS275 / FY16936) TaxID=402676 RepID=B6K514_SCHJY|nr:Pex19 protein family [Schizosaccharomyces japonicus yFS275]EEB08618.2 Pex19 protein family [Schizosaccharomyces japonicus yFS275]
MFVTREVWRKSPSTRLNKIKPLAIQPTFQKKATSFAMDQNHHQKLSRETANVNELDELDDILDEIPQQELKNKQEKTSEKKQTDDGTNNAMANLLEKIQNLDTLSAGTNGAIPNMNAFKDEDLFEKMFGANPSSGAGDVGVDYNALETMLDSLMSQVTSKQVLYEPLKDLANRYPECLQNMSEKDKSKYESQCKHIQECLNLFEDPNYDEIKDRQKVCDLVEKIQELPLPEQLMKSSIPPSCPLQ